MKKLFLYIFLVLMVCNTVQALPKCKGTDPNKWHNCSGTEESQNVKYEGEYQNGNFNGQGIARCQMEANTLENGKMKNFTDKEHLLCQMEQFIRVSGKKAN